jgi:hypothetical protein
MVAEGIYYQLNQQNVQVEELNQLGRDEILDLLRSHRIDEISQNLSPLVDSFIEYLPEQFFRMSQTMRNISRLGNLTYQEVDKLAEIFEMAVIFSDFAYFYELESEDREQVIADIIIEFDIAYWNDEQNAYENMVNKFKNIYGADYVQYIMMYDY